MRRDDAYLLDMLLAARGRRWSSDIDVGLTYAEFECRIVCFQNVDCKDRVEVVSEEAVSDAVEPRWAQTNLIQQIQETIRW